MKKRLFVCLLALLGVGIAEAQIQRDSATRQIAGQAMTKIYSFDFWGAEALVKQIQAKYPQHPVVPFLRAYSVSWQNLPLQKSQPAFAQYNSYLQDALQKSKAMLKANDDDVEGIYFTMAVYSLLALHESESGDFMQSVGYGKSAFSYMKRGFSLTEQNADFHFPTGVYKYYAVQYPETHPIAKPVMIFFPHGNKIEGLQHLQKAIEKGQFSKVEARIYASSIYAKYEQNYWLALVHTERLVTLHPNNPFFWMKHCENLLLNQRYAEAEYALKGFENRTEPLYQAGANLLRGWIQEKNYKNYAQARTYYQKLINLPKADRRYTQDYQAFAYAGLARIAQAEGNKTLAREHYRKVLKQAEYEGLKREAKAYLKS